MLWGRRFRGCQPGGNERDRLAGLRGNDEAQYRSNAHAGALRCRYATARPKEILTSAREQPLKRVSWPRLRQWRCLLACYILRRTACNRRSKSLRLMACPRYRSVLDITGIGMLPRASVSYTCAPIAARYTEFLAVTATIPVGS